MDSAQESEFLKTLGKRIRQLRKERRLSQDRLALECDLTQTYLSQVERGERNVSVLTLQVLARAMDITLAQMFEGMGK